MAVIGRNPRLEKAICAIPYSPEKTISALREQTLALARKQARLDGNGCVETSEANPSTHNGHNGITQKFLQLSLFSGEKEGVSVKPEEVLDGDSAAVSPAASEPTEAVNQGDSVETSGCRLPLPEPQPYPATETESMEEPVPAPRRKRAPVVIEERPELNFDEEDFSAWVSSLDGQEVLFLDTETTGLTPYSKPVLLKKRMDTTLRMRVITVGYWNETSVIARAWDWDAIPAYWRRQVLEKVLGCEILVGHNLTFDLNWTRYEYLRVSSCPVEEVPAPDYSLDTMLFARLLFPEIGLENGGFRLSDLFDFMNGVHPKIKGNADAESADIEDTVERPDRAGFEVLEEAARLEKQYQKPSNWAQWEISPEAWEYAVRDVTVLGEWLRWAQEQQFPESGDFLFWLCTLVTEPGDLLQELSGMYPNSLPWEHLERLVYTWTQIPTVLSTLFLRGQPFSEAAVLAYCSRQEEEVRTQAGLLVEAFPELASNLSELSDAEAGTTAVLKAALGGAFSSRGLHLDTTEKTGSVKIGVKDLRGVGANQNEATQAGFTAWKALNQAKRRITMAKDYLRFASFDGRIHPIFSPAAATARLTCSEPNMQQVPSDKEFRAFVKGSDTVRIIATDVSALDVRVGAALAVRLQRRVSNWRASTRAILQQLLSSESPIPWNEYRNPGPDVSWKEKNRREDTLRFIEGIWRDARRQLSSVERYETPIGVLARLEEEGERLLEAREWDAYRENRYSLLRERIASSLSRIAEKREEDGAYSSLREAFRLGVDIHSWTGAKLQGIPVEERFLQCQSPEEVSALNDAIKQELKTPQGDMRQLGKVANLGLLYGMAALGFLMYCKKTWDMHFLEAGEENLPEAEQLARALSRARQVRLRWMQANPEVDFFAACTELQAMLFPREENFSRKGGGVSMHTSARWMTRTLTGRPVSAGNKFAAMNYPNQGTGSDILLATKVTLAMETPEVFSCLINQVHDEMVLESPEEKAEEYGRILEHTLVTEGTRLIGPYGVPMKAETAIAPYWKKG